ncbi:recombination regulator RecX [Advenella sp. RU8]|uniref:recombination regulator RecX n=1 Tax=Advenella sp. RU8 TaxID=3399575 RepID=UPI003AAF1DC4
MSRFDSGNRFDDDDGFETVRVSKPSQNLAQKESKEAFSRTSELKKPIEKQAQTGKKPTISLLARAVNLLSRREHSELELSRKLLPHAESPEEVEQVLARLKKENWQSNQRFTHAFAQQKSSKWGTAKILQELKQHKLNAEDISDLKEQLEQSEFERAYEVWHKKFRGVAYSTPQEYAKQTRFLLSRGFNADVVRKIIGGQYPDDF